MKKAITVSAFLLAAAGLAGCAETMPPKELLDARAAYAQAEGARAAKLAQADLYEAKKALMNAERSYENGEESTRDLAYVAHRRALAAQARGETFYAMDDKKRLDQGIAEYKSRTAAQTEQQLAQAKKQLDAQGRELSSERQARVDAEKRTREALEKMAGMAAKQDPRGLVVTLSGSVLFASGKSELLSTAQTRLQEVAQALKEDGRPFTIVGHTDSQGDDNFNMKLSQSRADAVKNYFVSQGVDASTITTQGMGESSPIADNTSAEGRANNRRVEIILPPSAPTSAP